MTHGWSDLPLFYLLAEDEWPESRQGPSFLAAMRDAAQRRFKNSRWTGLASTYRFTTALPATNTTEPDDQAEVTSILEWHHPSIRIERYEVNDRDEDAPSGVLVRYWTVYDLDEADWERARITEVQCRLRTDFQLRQIDDLLYSFATAAFEKKIETFHVIGRARIKLRIPSTFWDVGISDLRTWYAHGRYRSPHGNSPSPHEGEAIFVEPDGLTAWLAQIAPISFDEPPDIATSRAFLADLEAALQCAADARQKRERVDERQLGIPGGKERLFAILKCPPFNLMRKDFEMLLMERSIHVFRKRGRPADSEIAEKILQNLVVKYGQTF